MNTFKQHWKSLTTPLSDNEDDARREQMTRVLFVLVSGGVFLMSIIVPAFDFSVGEPSYTSSFVMLAIDFCIAIGWFLIYRGNWDISRFLLPSLFLAIGVYLIYQAGLLTTGVLQFAIAIVLTSMLFGDKAQWMTVGASEVFYLVTGYLAGERDFEIFVTGGIVVGFSLSGIALLQWYSSALLKKSFEQLRQAEGISRGAAEKIRAVFESMDDGIIITDLDGNIIDLNDAIIRLYGSQTKSELIGLNAFDLVAVQDRKRAIKNLDLKMKNRKSGIREYRFLTKSGREIDGELNAVLIVDGNNHPSGFVGLIRDISARKSAEAERESLIKQLEEKNTELENFTYTVSHDLKSPLITIGGFVNLLEEDLRVKDTAKIEKDIQRINEATQKMRILLDELLELSRIGRMMNPPQAIPFGSIVEEAIGLVEGQLSEGKVEVQIEANMPNVYGDRIRLAEVVQNLVDNAIKFMGKQEHPLIEIGTRMQGNKLVFFVKDNGIGIEPHHQEKIFALFDKLDKNSKGTGIGLALVKRIVNVHNGNIWVESQGMGTGSTFCFTLPQVPEESGQEI